MDEDYRIKERIQLLKKRVEEYLKEIEYAKREIRDLEILQGKE